jgi:hypothetical protein
VHWTSAKFNCHQSDVCLFRVCYGKFIGAGLTTDYVVLKKIGNGLGDVSAGIVRDRFVLIVLRKLLRAASLGREFDVKRRK